MKEVNGFGTDGVDTANAIQSWLLDPATREERQRIANTVIYRKSPSTPTNVSNRSEGRGATSIKKESSKVSAPQPLPPELDLSDSRFLPDIEGLPFLEARDVSDEIIKTLSFIAGTSLFARVVKDKMNFLRISGSPLSEQHLRQIIFIECRDYIQSFLRKLGKRMEAVYTSLVPPNPALSVLEIPHNFSTLLGASARYYMSITGEGYIQDVNVTTVHTLAARTALLPLLGFPLDEEKHIAIPPWKETPGKEELNIIHKSTLNPHIHYQTRKKIQPGPEGPQLVAISERFLLETQKTS